MSQSGLVCFDAMVLVLAEALRSVLTGRFLVMYNIQYSGLDIPHPGIREESHSGVIRETWTIRRHGGIETLL